MSVAKEGRHLLPWKEKLMRDLFDRCAVTDKDGHRELPPQLDANQVMLAIFAAEKSEPAL